MEKDLEQEVLSLLAKQEIIEDTYQLAESLRVDHQELVGVVKSLLVDRYVLDEPLTSSFWLLTAEGREILVEGSPELLVLRTVSAGGEQGVSVGSLGVLGEKGKIGLGVCMKNKWVEKRGDALFAKMSPDTVPDSVQQILRQVEEGGQTSGIAGDLEALKKRKLVVQQTRKSLRLRKGPDFRPQRVRKMAELHRSMLGAKDEASAGSHWSELSFKSVNLNAMGAGGGGGSFHPLLKVRAEFRRILMDLGFQEMPTSRWVESSFWNFDALFQPQSHPA
eukprot:gene40749-49695_t